MIPTNMWEHQNAIKTLYAKCVGDVCGKHGVTRIELDVLLFLANNRQFDTATDIVEVRYLSKSLVSAAVSHMEDCGYLRKEYAQANRKTAHLRICDAAAQIVADGQAAQKRFFDILLQGMTQEEMEGMRRCMDHIFDNINRYLK